jgi:hypothetical protein
MSTLSFPEAVRRTSELAHARLPESLHGNIERATAIVLNGGVVYDEDGKHAMVRASNGQTWYPVNGHCTCMGAPHAPEGLCKHALAARIYVRAGDLMREGLHAPDAAKAPRAKEPRCPEAEFSCSFTGTIGGVSVILTARGATFEAFAANVQAVRALLDAAPPAQKASAHATAGAAWVCPYHGAGRESTKVPGQRYCPAKMADGGRCKEVWPARQ